MPRRGEVEWDGSVVRLPYDSQGEVDFSTWGEAEPRLLEFAKQHRRRGARTATVVLLPRPDNIYNRYAVSVARPAEPGSTPDERHLGYLFDHFLRGIGPGRLPRLARYAASGEIECTLDVRKNHLTLAIPDGQELGRVINKFLAEHPVAPASDKARHGEVDGEAEAATARCLDLLALVHGTPSAPIATDDLRLVGYGANGVRGLWVTDAGTGQFIGSLQNRILTLEDERARMAVLHHLLGLGIDVAAPIGRSAVADAHQIPRMALIQEATHIQLSPLEVNGRPDRSLKIAYYVPLVESLWVATGRLVDPVRLFAERHGLRINKLHVPLMDWGLDGEFEYHDLHGHTAHRERFGRWDPSRGSGQYRLPHLKGLLPPEVRGADSLEWRACPDDTLPEPEDQFRLLERYFTDRAMVFGAVELGDSIVPCRLCGRRTLEFEAPGVEGRLAYCDHCRTTAREGWLGRSVDAPIVLRALAAIEFAGRAVLRQELDQIGPRPDGSLRTASEVDRLLLLRSFISRRESLAWTKVLIASGLADEGVRMSRGTAIPAVDGHACGSMLEKAVDDFLHHVGIQHTREPAYPRHPELNANGYRADWQLADGTFVEMWGMPDDPTYAEKMTAKRRLAETLGIPLIEIFPPDVNGLRAVFADVLPTS